MSIMWVFFCLLPYGTGATLESQRPEWPPVAVGVPGPRYNNAGKPCKAPVVYLGRLGAYGKKGGACFSSPV